MGETMEKYFPNGLSVLVVDDDPTFLKRIRMVLLSCNYKATTCANPCSALSILRERASEFDLLLSDIDMPEMSGFDLLDIVRVEYGLPVVLMSIDIQLEFVRKGLSKGACCFLTKPVDISDVTNLWQYATSKGGIVSQKTPQIANFTSSSNRGENLKRSKEKGPMIIEGEDKHDSTKSDKKKKGKEKKNAKEKEEDHDFDRQRKTSVVWTADLENKFLDALNILGKAAVPSKIVKLMNVEGLSRYNVASHLQKYRLKKRTEPRKPSVPIAPLPHGSSMSKGKSKQFPDQLLRFDPEPNYMPTLSPSLQMSMPRITPWPLPVPSSPAAYNLSYVQSCLKNLKLNGNIEMMNPNDQGAPSFDMMTTPQEQFVVDPTDAANEFQAMGGGDSSVQPEEFNSNAQIYDESNDYFPAAIFEATDDVGLFFEAQNDVDLMQYDVWGDTTLSVPEFTASNNNNITSTDNLMEMSPGQWSSTDFGQQYYQAVESSSKMADIDEDFGDLIEKFAYGNDPLAQILDDDFRFRFGES